MKTMLYKLTVSVLLVSTIGSFRASAFAQNKSRQKEKIRYEERNKPNRLREYNRKDKYNKSEYSSEPQVKKHSENREQKGTKSPKSFNPAHPPKEGGLKN